MLLGLYVHAVNHRGYSEGRPICRLAAGGIKAVLTVVVVTALPSCPYFIFKHGMKPSGAKKSCFFLAYSLTCILAIIQSVMKHLS